MIDRAPRRAAAAAALALVAGCARAPDGAAPTADAAAPAKEPAHLPAPFDAVRVGTPLAELTAKFPPSEDVGACAPRLVGGAPKAVAPDVPGAEKKARSRCARLDDLAGALDAEEKRTDAFVADKVDPWAARVGVESSDWRRGHEATVALVRAALRSGAVSEAAVVAVGRGEARTAYAAVRAVAGELFQGGEEFALARTARREVAAVIADDCDDLDADRVRAYVRGDYSLGQIAQDANTRVQYGACRAPFVQGWKRLGGKFMHRAGALGGVGLARGMRPDKRLDPGDPSTYFVYTSRSKLAPAAARLGVTLANALDATEAHFRGAIALSAPADAASPWGTALVWVEGGRVARALVNVRREEALGDLPRALGEAYGAPGTTEGAVTTFALGAGVGARLDLGGALALTVGAPAKPAAPAASASAPAPAP